MRHIVSDNDARNYRGGPTKALCGHGDARTTSGPGGYCPACVRKAGWSKEKEAQITRDGPKRVS
jgi:hypothetical protein